MLVIKEKENIMFDNFIAGVLPTIFDILIRCVGIFIITLGIIYILGRMLNILKGDTSRNFVAVTMISVLSYLSIVAFDDTSDITNVIWRMLVYIAVSCILFVIIGFDFFNRANSWLDSHFAVDPESGKRKPVKKTKRQPSTKKTTKTNTNKKEK